MDDSAEATKDASQRLASRSLNEQNIASLDRLIADDDTNVTYLDLKAKAVNNVGGTYSGEAPLVFIAQAEKAARLTEQALQRAPWSPTLKASLAHYEHWIGDTLRETGKTAEALVPLSRALGLRGEISRQDPTRTEWQNDYDQTLAGLRAAYIVLDAKQASPADRDSSVRVERTIMERQLQRTGATPADREALFALVEDHFRLANATRLVGQRNEALEHFRQAAAMVDAQALVPGADQRYRYWALWARRMGTCSDWQDLEVTLDVKLRHCEC